MFSESLLNCFLDDHSAFCLLNLGDFYVTMTSTQVQSYWGVSIKKNGGVLMATFALEFQDLWLTWWWLWVVSLILRTLEVWEKW